MVKAWCWKFFEMYSFLGVDTRNVCELGEEESVQRMIEKINPNLRFTRNYEKIRPHTEYCEEIIYLEK